MIGKKKIALIAGATVLAASLLAGAAFAAAGPNAAALEARIQRIDQAVTDGTMSQGMADVLKELDQLRLSVMEKLQADSQAIVDQAVTEGSITQEEADSLMSRGGRTAFGRGGFKGGAMGFGMQGMTEEALKARLDAAVAAGSLTQEQADQILSGEAPTGFMRGGPGRFFGR